MSAAMRLRLSVMMFGQYFVWGAWWVTLGAYLNASGFDEIIGAVYSTQGIAAIATPLFIGAVADRYFAAQKLMGVLHLCGAATLLVLALAHGSAERIFALVLLYMCFYMPTLPLSNAVAMNAMTRTEAEFPKVRVLGTIGWIVAGLTVGLGPSLLARLGLISGSALVPIEGTNIPILVAAAASLAVGLYSFSLPDTPPRARGRKMNVMSVLGLDILPAVKGGAFWVFIICSLLIVAPLSFYYAYTNTFLVEVGATLQLGGLTFTPVSLQTLGQISEIVFMLLLPLLFARWGVRWILAIGMLAWALRYVLFAYGVSEVGPTLWMLLAGVALHGVCYDFFFVAGQIHVDKIFSPDMRARAQSFLALATLGVGQLIGSNLANTVYVANTVSAEIHRWREIWLLPAGLALGVAAIFLLLFPGRRGAAV